MRDFLNFVRNFFRSRYVRELERRLAVLERDNRNLINSLLGTGGVPPLPEREQLGLTGATTLAPRRPIQRPRTMAQVLRRHETADLKRIVDQEAQIREALERARQQKAHNAHQEDNHAQRKVAESQG